MLVVLSIDTMRHDIALNHVVSALLEERSAVAPATNNRGHLASLAPYDEHWENLHHEVTIRTKRRMRCRRGGRPAE